MELLINCSDCKQQSNLKFNQPEFNDYRDYPIEIGKGSSSIPCQNCAPIQGRIEWFIEVISHHFSSLTALLNSLLDIEQNEKVDLKEPNHILFLGFLAVFKTNELNELIKEVCRRKINE